MTDASYLAVTDAVMNLEEQRRDYFGALEWVGGLMTVTTPDQLDVPTPCEEFTVRELMGHLIGTARRSTGTAQGISTRHVPHVVEGVADGDLAATYVSIARDIRELWQSAADGDRVTAPWGMCTARWSQCLGGRRSPGHRHRGNRSRS
jgi:hypothetical protein